MLIKDENVPDLLTDWPIIGSVFRIVIGTLQSWQRALFEFVFQEEYTAVEIGFSGAGSGPERTTLPPHLLSSTAMGI